MSIARGTKLAITRRSDLQQGSLLSSKYLLLTWTRIYATIGETVVLTLTIQRAELSPVLKGGPRGERTEICPTIGKGSWHS